MDKKFEKALMPHLLAAVKYARSRLPLKATNKIYTDKRMVSQMMSKDPKRWSLHTAEADDIRERNIRALRALKLAPRETANKLEHDYINRIPHAGNCGENAILAYYYLLDRAQRLDSAAKTEVQIMRVYLPAPVDHAFVLIGTRPAGYSRLLLENTLVCDPWTKIVCRLEDFDKLWRLKMEKWSSRGLAGLCGEGYYSHHGDSCSLNTVRIGKLQVDQERNQSRYSAGQHSLVDGQSFR